MKDKRRGKLIIPIGASGSGKSSYWRNELDYVDNEDYNSCVGRTICPDTYRKFLTGDELNQDENSLVFEICHKIAEARCKHGLTTYFDATNLNRKSRKKLVDIAGNCDIMVIVFDVTFKELLKRNKTRTFPRPEWVVRKHFDKMEQQIKNIFEESNMGWYSEVKYERLIEK